MRKSISESTENGGVPTKISISMKSRIEDQLEQQSLVLWKRPLATLDFFVRELVWDLQRGAAKLWENKKAVAICLLLTLACTIFYHMDGPHQKYVRVLQKKVLWSAYWVGLGVLSSIGLGTGLHTFLLYLGPHIAAVTLAAYECGGLNFPEPPYPDEIICPDVMSGTKSVGILSIMSKVRLESFMWGVGTALGELPPYFMARAARLSGQETEELDDLDEEEKPFLQKAKLVVQNLVEKVGFLGILLCASIPNPLFDLAGITCGHFLVPFWTFFGATLIGKAIVKMHIQMLFVIVAFNEIHVETLVKKIRYLPYFGKLLQAPFKEFFAKQKAKLHRKAGSSLQQESSWLAWIFEKFVILMILYFILSIVNSMAQNHFKRLKRKRKGSQKQAGD